MVKKVYWGNYSSTSSLAPLSSTRSHHEQNQKVSLFSAAFYVLHVSNNRLCGDKKDIVLEKPF